MALVSTTLAFCSGAGSGNRTWMISVGEDE